MIVSDAEKARARHRGWPLGVSIGYHCFAVATA
jgi:hypothetical protein